MTHRTLYRKVISYFLTSLIIFQSCTVYQSHSTSVEDAALYGGSKIKIKTTSGTRYAVSWVEEREGKIYSVRNTKIDYIKKQEFISMSMDQKLHISRLDSAMHISGDILLITKDPKNKRRYHNHQFFRMAYDGHMIRGYKIVNPDTISISLPKDQVASIRVEDHGASTAVNTGIAILGIVAATSLIVLATYENPVQGMTFTK